MGPMTKSWAHVVWDQYHVYALNPHAANVGVSGVLKMAGCSSATSYFNTLPPSALPDARRLVPLHVVGTLEGLTSQVSQGVAALTPQSASRLKQLMLFLELCQMGAPYAKGERPQMDGGCTTHARRCVTRSQLCTVLAGRERRHYMSVHVQIALSSSTI